MRYTASLLLVSVACFQGAAGSFLRSEEESGVGTEWDLGVSRRLLSLFGFTIGEAPPPPPQGVPPQFDSVIGRQYEYEEGSDASLLNQVIEIFLPHVNSAFQSIAPDPLNLPLRGGLNLPEINLFGYCTVNAGFNLSLGTMVGMSTLQIDRIQVLGGTERIKAGWNLDEGCLETIFTAFFDMELSSPVGFSVNDMYGGIHGNICSYSIDELITGGVQAYLPRMRGAINITGSIVGTKASIKMADIGNAFQIGYDSMEAYLDNASPGLDEAVRNITSELSILAKERITKFIMQDEVIKSIEPEVNSRAARSFIGREAEIPREQALYYNTRFMRNQMGDKVDTAVGGALSWVKKLGFYWT